MKKQIIEKIESVPKPISDALMIGHAVEKMIYSIPTKQDIENLDHKIYVLEKYCEENK